MEASEQLVHEQVTGHTCVITLNRPKKLNSLTAEMIEVMIDILLKHKDSPEIASVIIKSSSSRAFCAGGDVAQARNLAASKQINLACKFFHEEYSLNYLIAIYPKPIISFIEGITMGGGVGISVHGCYRICTKTTRLAMPELDIGFFTDVGTSFILPRLDFSIGIYLALTGDSLVGADNLVVGFATHYAESVNFEEIIAKLTNLETSKQIKDLLDKSFSSKVNEDHKFRFNSSELAIINSIFNINNSIEEMFQLLEEQNDDFSIKILNNLKKKSFLSMKLTLRLLKKGKSSTINQSLRREMLLAENLMINSDKNDFIEGVTTKLITKTNEPDWKFKDIKSIKDEQVDFFFNNKIDQKMGYEDLIEFNNGIFLPDYTNVSSKEKI